MDEMSGGDQSLLLVHFGFSSLSFDSLSFDFEGPSVGEVLVDGHKRTSSRWPSTCR